MKKLSLLMMCFLFFLVCVGCKQKPQYSGSIKSHVKNGDQYCIEVQFPSNGYVCITNPEDADALIKQTELLLNSLKQARSQFPNSPTSVKLSEKERLIAQTEIALASLRNNKSSKEEDIRAIEALLTSLKGD